MARVPKKYDFVGSHLIETTIIGEGSLIRERGRFDPYARANWDFTGPNLDPSKWVREA